MCACVCVSVCGRPTSVRAVERGEGHDEEGGGVLPCVHQVGEGALGVAVAPQALDEAHPGGETLDDGPHAVRVAVAHKVVWGGGGEDSVSDSALLARFV